MFSRDSRMFRLLWLWPRCLSVRPYVRLSVCHTLEPYQNGAR